MGRSYTTKSGIYCSSKDLLWYANKSSSSNQYNNLEETINLLHPSLCKEKRHSDIIVNDTDLTNLEWSFSKDSPGTAGMFLKSRDTIDNKLIFFKMSAYNSKDLVYGHESVFEIIAQRVADVLGLRHLVCNLINAKVKVSDEVFNTYIVASSDYRHKGEVRMSFESYYQQYRQSGESTKDFVLRSEFKVDFLKMLVFDYIIYNRDRHSNNIELLVDSKTEELRLAPMMDHGCCLTSILYKDWINLTEDYYLVDKPVNNCIGSLSVLENLKGICKERVKFSKIEELPDDLLYGLQPILGEDYCDFILNMLKVRWNYAVEILNS